MAIMVMFNPYLRAYLPLGTEEKLASSSFPIPISFFYGDDDWCQKKEGEGPLDVIEANRKMHGNQS